jgi:hypothetical protein
MDLREQWNQVSGILRTVANMVADITDDGEFLYEAIPVNSELESIRNLQLEATLENGNEIYANSDVSLTANSTTHIATHQSEDYIVQVQYSQASSSYIQQMSDSIMMGVTSGDLISTIGLSVDGETSKINLLADKIILDGEVIAQTLIAEQADIGGVVIGCGEISSSSETGCYKLDSAGTINATNANISGAISATSLYIDDNAYFSGTVYASKGKIGAFTLDSAGTMFVENQNNDILSMINASNYYNVSGKTAMIACGLSGITDTNTMYGWTCEDYSGITLFTMVDYSSAASTNNMSVAIGDEVEAWIGQLNEDTNGYELIGGYSVKVKASNNTGSTNSFYISTEYHNNPSLDNGTELTSKKPNDDLVLKGGGGVAFTGGSEATQHNFDNLQFEKVQMCRCYNCGAWLPVTLEYCDVCGSLNIYYTGSQSNAPSIQSLCYKIGGFNYYFQRDTGVTINVSGVHPSYLSNYASTIIYDDGTLQTKLLQADNGFFGGEIDSFGKFRGELDNANGSLNGVIISNGVLNGSLLLGLDDTISRSDSGGNQVFKMDDSVLEFSLPNTNYYHITPFVREYKNWKFHMINAGPCDQYQQLYAFRFSIGDTITIPQIFTKFIINNAWKHNVIPVPKVGLSLITMVGNVRTVIPIRNYEQIPNATETTGANKTYTYTINGHTYTASGSGIAVLCVQYGIGLPQRHPLPSLPLASTAVALVCGLDKISVGRNTENKPDILQTHFGKNGVVFTFGSASSLSFIDGKTNITHGSYGLKIDSEGIKKTTNGGDTYTSI